MDLAEQVKQGLIQANNRAALAAEVKRLESQLADCRATFDAAAERSKRLRAVNAELLEVLERWEPIICGRQKRGQPTVEPWAQLFGEEARSAITKAKGA